MSCSTSPGVQGCFGSSQHGVHLLPFPGDQDTMAQHSRSMPQPAKHPLRSLSVPTFGMGTSHSAPYTSPTTDGKVLGSLTGCMDSCTSCLQGTAPPQFCAGRKEKSLKDAPARIKEEFCPRSFADIHKFGCIYDCYTISLTETQVSSPPPSPSRFFFWHPNPYVTAPL